MTSYHLSVKTVSRATGRSGPGAAAYRTATRLMCERDGTTHDYTRRSGVDSPAFIVTPEGADWAQDRSALWNAVEAAEKRKDAKVAREYELALPHELDRDGRRALAGAFAREVVSRFGVAADVAIHAPGQEGDQRNWHAHILTTTRAVTAEGLGAKTRELDVAQTSGPAVEALRALWAVQVNQALERIQVEARVDHRSFARRGVEREAEQHLGVAASGMERKAARRAAAPEAAEVAPLAALPEPAREGQKRAQAGAGAGFEPERGSEPAPELERPPAASMGEKPPRMAQEAVLAVPAALLTGPASDRPVRPSAGVFGAGAVPATRIGQRNAEVRERNQARDAARRVLETVRTVLEGLERAAAAGVRRVLDLARGLGAQGAAERETRAQAAIREQEAQMQAWAAQRAEMERAAAERRAEQARIAAEQRRQRDEAVQRQADPARHEADHRTATGRAGIWKEAEDVGRKLRQADRARQRPSPERDQEQEHEGPSLGM